MDAFLPALVSVDAWSFCLPFSSWMFVHACAAVKFSRILAVSNEAYAMSKADNERRSISGRRVRQIVKEAGITICKASVGNHTSIGQVNPSMLRSGAQPGQDFSSLVSGAVCGAKSEPGPAYCATSAGFSE